jgi:hypothetical protein
MQSHEKSARQDTRVGECLIAHQAVIVKGTAIKGATPNKVSRRHSMHARDACRTFFPPRMPRCPRFCIAWHTLLASCHFGFEHAHWPHMMSLGIGQSPSRPLCTPGATMWHPLCESSRPNLHYAAPPSAVPLTIVDPQWHSARHSSLVIRLLDMGTAIG